MKKAIIILSFIAIFMVSALAFGIVYSKYHTTVETTNNPMASTTKETQLTNTSTTTKKNKAKIVYLTFDDGPSSNITPKILDILKKNDVKATFFVLGVMCRENPAILKRTRDEGHYIANHSYSHSYKYLYSSTEHFLLDIKKCDDTIVSILGPEYKTKLVRFPGGAFSKKTIPYKKELKKLGYEYINWNSSIADAAFPHVPVYRMLKNVKAYSSGKKEVVLLMHDSGTKDTTAASLPQIIEYFKSNGYTFETLKNYKNDGTKN